MSNTALRPGGEGLALPPADGTAYAQAQRVGSKVRAVLGSWLGPGWAGTGRRAAEEPGSACGQQGEAWGWEGRAVPTCAQPLTAPPSCVS